MKKVVTCVLAAFMVFALTGCGAAGSVDNTGKKVAVNYTGTLDDGSKFDSSYDRGQPLEFTVGAGQMISGFDDAVKTMHVGETKTVHLTPDEAYGEYDPSKVVTVDKSSILQPSTYSVGTKVVFKTSQGKTVQGTVSAIQGDQVTVDTNAEMAGKNLTFEITLEKIE